MDAAAWAGVGCALAAVLRSLSRLERMDEVKKLLMAQGHWLISLALLAWSAGVALAAYAIIDRVVLARWEGQDMATVLTGLVLLAAVRLGYGPARSALDHILYQEALLRVLRLFGLMTPWARYRTATGYSTHSLKETDEVADNLKVIGDHLSKLVAHSESRTQQELFGDTSRRSAEVDDEETDEVADNLKVIADHLSKLVAHSESRTQQELFGDTSRRPAEVDDEEAG